MRTAIIASTAVGTVKSHGAQLIQERRIIEVEISHEGVLASITIHDNEINIRQNAGRSDGRHLHAGGIFCQAVFADGSLDGKFYNLIQGKYQQEYADHI